MDFFDAFFWTWPHWTSALIISLKLFRAAFSASFRPFDLQLDAPCRALLQLFRRAHLIFRIVIHIFRLNLRRNYP